MSSVPSLLMFTSAPLRMREALELLVQLVDRLHLLAQLLLVGAHHRQALGVIGDGDVLAPEALRLGDHFLDRVRRRRSTSSASADRRADRRSRSGRGSLPACAASISPVFSRSSGGM